VERLSGGEKARLALALIIWQRPNLLLLDEPTNHLDIDMREALTEALQEYTGALVLVSHDRHLLRTTCDAFLLVADGQVVPYDGDLDDYRQAMTARRPGEAQSGKGPSRKDERREAAQNRDAQTKNRRSVEKKIKAVETRMTAVAAEQARCDGQLASAEFYGDGSSTAVRQMLQERARIATATEQLEAEWLALNAEIEKMTA
jgi:ATP-binding cassette subfamily F protein 3